MTANYGKTLASKKTGCPPLSGRETEVLGVRTHYYQMGDAGNRPLLLVHGMTTSADSYRETMYGLADSYFLIAPDLPGFGLTDEIQPFTIEHLAYWLYAFCEQLGLTHFGLIGHSFGGVLALCFAAMFPALISRMLLAAPPFYNAQSYPGYLRRLALVSGAYALGVALSKSWPLIHWRVRSPFYAPDLVDEDIFIRRAVDYRRARASAQALKTLAFTDLDPCAEQKFGPVCLVWGEDDETVPLADAERLAAHFDDVRLKTIPACGHVTVAEKPDQFVDIAGRFFSQGE